MFTEITTYKNLPFTPDLDQVIYIESYFNKELNRFITANYDEVCKLFKDIGLTFIYLPKIIENTNYDTIRYLYPFLNKEDIILNKTDAQTIIDELLLYRKNEEHRIGRDGIPQLFSPYYAIPRPFPYMGIYLTGGLLKFTEDYGDRFVFSYYEFTDLKESKIREQINAYLPEKDDSDAVFNSEEINIYADDYDIEDYADYHFNLQAEQLIKEIKERVDALKQIGINEMVLKSLFPFKPKIKLSRLIITSDYRIHLPDYNKEIVMHPLPKAIFILFLKHPEGILFKHLSDHRKELIEIYKTVATKGDIADLNKSIDDLIDPTKNAINEKCARIREAFIKEFDESIAQNYFITGERAAPKRITLDRSLVLIAGKI
ncbi:MAG: hypothetical protein FWF53_10440 [Candidatus Azobacteroides sp.]|nr:hypothetical protein [Candidatus Azobacteroides sp.]